MNQSLHLVPIVSNKFLLIPFKIRKNKLHMYEPPSPKLFNKKPKLSAKHVLAVRECTNDNVDNLFAKELQTIPLILKLYI